MGHMLMALVKLDFNATRLAHVRWEMALELLVRGEGTAGSLHGHEDCDLGKWIYGTGLKSYGKHDSIWHLKTAHKKFHAAADDTLSALAAHDLAGVERSISLVRKLSGEILFQLTSLELDIIRNALEKNQEDNTKSRLWRFLAQKVSQSSFSVASLDNSSHATLNVTGVRLAHLQWIRDLQTAFRGHSKKIKAQPSEECSLGVWIHNKAMKELGTTETLKTLDTIHKRFHHEIDRVLVSLAQRKDDRADESYESALDLSREIITELTKLQIQHSDADFFAPLCHSHSH